MESLREFRGRTAFMSDSLPAYGELRCDQAQSLLCKVNEEAHLKPFFGNTIVFVLDEAEQERLCRVQHRLYEACGDMLCADRLKKESLHITLHDLVSGVPGHATLRSMNTAYAGAMRMLPEILSQFDKPILMRPTWVFSMVNTSVVQGYEPADEGNCARLMEMYERLHQVVMPAYPYLTPHATLAYYRPAAFSNEQLQRLRSVLAELSEPERRRTWGEVDGRSGVWLKREALHYQEFFDMNDYRSMV